MPQPACHAHQLESGYMHKRNAERNRRVIASALGLLVVAALIISMVASAVFVIR